MICLNKINGRGLCLIEYKEEMNKNYSKLIKDSLKLSLEKMVENEVITISDFERIVDSDISLEGFEKYIISRTNFIKTDEEIFEDFEVIRESLTDAFIKESLDEFTSESLIKEDVIKVSKLFVADELFLMDFFGIYGKDFNDLYTRKGFVEKFLAIRYLKILKDACESVEYDKQIFTLTHSVLLYDKEDYKHKIALQFDIDVDTLVESKSDMSFIVKHIKEISDTCSKYFNQRNIV